MTESKSLRDETLEELDDRMDERTMDGLIDSLAQRALRRKGQKEPKPGSEKAPGTPEN